MISIIVPVYNVEPYLRQCVDSVLAQTLTDFELLLVDDGSSDGSGAICDEYARKDARVRVLHKQNGGAASAWIAGVQAAAGSYVGFVDSDDWIDPCYFEHLYRTAAETGADVVSGGNQTETPDRPPFPWFVTSPAVYEGEADIRRLMRLYFVWSVDPKSCQSGAPLSFWRVDKLYRRRLFMDNLGCLDPGIRWGEDLMANTAVLPDCRRIVVLGNDGPKYHYRRLDSSVSSTLSRDPFAAPQLDNTRRLGAVLMAIAEKKGLDTAAVAAYLGRLLYPQIYAFSCRRDIPLGKKCAVIRQACAAAPRNALREYARLRGGLFLRLFCAMLRAGLIAPCVWIVTLHSALSGQKT